MTPPLPVPLGVMTLRLLGRLRDDGALELATARGVESLAERLAEYMEEEGDGVAEIAEWLVEQPEVVDLFADDAALGATLQAIRRELTGPGPSPSIKPTKRPAKPRAPGGPKTARPVETYARWDEAHEVITIAGKSVVETVDGLALWWARVFEAAAALDPAAWTAILVDPRDDNLYAVLARQDDAGLTPVSPRFAAHLPKGIDPVVRSAVSGPSEGQPYAWVLAEGALAQVAEKLRALRERHPAPIHRWPAEMSERLERRLA